MSKYDPLWDYVKGNGAPSLTLTFDEMQRIAGVPIDHSFLTYKKEMLACGWRVGKISMKNRTVRFEKTEGSST